MAKSSDKIAVRVEKVKKDFLLPHEQMSSIKSTVLNIFRKRNREIDVYHALKDISFDIKKGEFFGIVGRNGSGKSTLLKIIAEIYQPTKGSVEVNGKLVPFIELGVGFNPELTGRENIFLNGSLLGFSRKEIAAMYDEIVSFAELENFMDQKLKNYSSGMQVRLAFSVAIRAKSDILVLDEVLAVGDEAFQRKCNEYFDSIRKAKNKTIILVTHDMESVRRYCDRAVLIMDGLISKIGAPDKVASAYSDIFIQEQIEQQSKKDHSDSEDLSKKRQLSDVTLDSISIIQDNMPTNTVKFLKDFSLEVNLTAAKAYTNLAMGIHFFDQAGRDMLAISTKALGELQLHKGTNTIRFTIQNIFTDGNYYINFAVEENESKKLLVQQHEVAPFSIVGLNKTQYSRHSLTYPVVKMQYEKK